MFFPKPRTRLLAAFALSLGLAACGGGGGNDPAENGNAGPGNDPTQPPTVVSTLPVDGAAGIDPLASIQFVMNEDIDPASINAASVIIDSPDADVAAPRGRVNGNVITFVLEAPLPRGARITARLLAGALDSQGDALENDFAFRFDVEQVREIASQGHETSTLATRVGALRLGSNGNGMSIMRTDAGALLYHRILDGRPSGTALPIVISNATNVNQDNLDIASNGDAQISWLSYENSRRILRVKRWDAVSQTWAQSLTLTPSPLSEVNEFSSEINDAGGMIAWTEQSVSDTSKQAVFVGFPEANGDMDEPYGLRLATARRFGLRFDRSGTESVIAWGEADTSSGYRVAVVSHHQVTGFGSIQTLTAQGQISTVVDAKASSSGYRFLLYKTRDAADANKDALFLAVAKPTESFGLPTRLFAGTGDLSAAKLVVNDAGIASVVYALTDGQPGVWFRRYIPTTGFETAIEITGVAEAPGGSASRGVDVSIDSVGNAVVLASHPGGGSYRQVIVAGVISRVSAPIVGIRLDVAMRAPASRDVQIVRHPNTSTQLFWAHKDAVDPLDYDLRSRRMAPNGVFGPIDYYSADADVVVSGTRAAFAPSGNGLVVFTELFSPIYEVRHALLD
ncbi:MAG: Ig-like domain-containing protein [bacterium]|nr:Ig-like domain-containing protein [bacterium]